MTAWKERLLASSIPVLFVIALYKFFIGIFIIPIAMYFFAKKYSMDFVADHSLRFFDLLITLIISLFIMGLILSGIAIVARDGGTTIPLISNGQLKDVLKIIFVSYFIIGVFLHLIFASLGRNFTMPLSFMIFERIRGKNSQKHQNTTD